MNECISSAAVLTLKTPALFFINIWASFNEYFTPCLKIFNFFVPLQRGKTPPNKCPGHDTKQSYGEFPVKLELLGMWSILHCLRSQVHSGPEW